MTDDHKGDILIVDDTPANLRLLAQMLADHGYQARPVPDGPLALAAARAAPPDLVLLDIRMPGMDGYEVCEELKADEQTRDVPVIFISALDATEDKVRAFTAGGLDYVTKPFQVEEVLARVETHLALRRLQKELQEANRRMERELALAGRVQASFLPQTVPQIDGWQITATLEPARETSGDFYDFLPLPGGRLGIVVADVTDKGAGAALLMALSCALIRTFTLEYPDEPERALDACNHRILADTRSAMFVTAFYGILDPESGRLTYCNAGHNPPYLLRRTERAGTPGAIEALDPTGLALGMAEGFAWERGVAQLGPWDALVIYTDGITEARNPEGVLYGEERLQAAIQAGGAAAGPQGMQAQALQDAILADVHGFVGDAPQADDIALVVVLREEEG